MNGPAAVAEPAHLRWRAGIVATSLAVGMVALALSLNIAPGSGGFYVATTALAAVWLVGASLAGPGPAGRLGVTRWGRGRIAEPFLLGLGLALAFVLGALIVREIDALADAVDDVLDYARRGSGPLVVALTVATGVAEEVFFRGALYDTLPRRHATVVSTIVYVVATLASGSAMLAFAALVLGTVLGAQRRLTGGCAGPAITHTTWSVAMLLVLPLIIDVK
jgi:membrane protease YdiL (CAAX protease family)